MCDSPPIQWHRYKPDDYRLNIFWICSARTMRITHSEQQQGLTEGGTTMIANLSLPWFFLAEWSPRISLTFTTRKRHILWQMIMVHAFIQSTKIKINTTHTFTVSKAGIQIRAYFGYEKEQLSMWELRLEHS